MGERMEEELTTIVQVQFMKENGKKTGRMVSEFTLTIMEKSMKAIG
jgi:hypothetical protein